MLKARVRSLLTELRSNVRVGATQVLGRRLEAAAITGSELERHGATLAYYGPEEHGRIESPWADGSVPDELASIVGPYAVGRQGIVELRDGYLLGPSAVAVTRHGAPLLESALGREEVLRSSLQASTKAMLRGVALQLGADAVLAPLTAPALDCVVPLCNAFCRGYYHWVIDDLLLLQAIERFARDAERPKLLVVESPPRFQLESLRLLGWADRDLLHWNPRQGLARVQRLVVPLLRRRYPFVSGEACRWLGERARAAAGCVADGSRGSRIYISRRKAGGRRVSNEDEVVAELARWNFSMHCLEDLSFAEQVRLFADAELIVAPHGAGLANLVFSRATAVLELSHVFPYYVPFYQALAQALGFPYGFLECRPVGDTDLWVDVVRMRRALEWLDPHQKRMRVT